MSTTGWHRGVLHSEGPTGTAADRTIERTAIEAAGLGIYQLALVRRGLGEPRVVAYLGGCGRGIGPCESECLDLHTGEAFIVSSTDPEWEARALRVTELPPALHSLRGHLGYLRGGVGSPAPPVTAASGR